MCNVSVNVFLMQQSQRGEKVPKLLLQAENFEIKNDDDNNVQCRHSSSMCVCVCV